MSYLPSEFEFVPYVKADLAANNHRHGLVGFISSLLFTPGFLVVFLHRLAVFLSDFGAIGRLLSKVVWRVNVAMSGCYFSVKSEIGPGLRLPHPTGIVVGDGVKLGCDVTLYQGVTLGVKNVEKGDYPSVGSRVTIYAGSVICGQILVADDAVVGANSVLFESVPEGGRVAGVPARQVGITLRK